LHACSQTIVQPGRSGQVWSAILGRADLAPEVLAMPPAILNLKDIELHPRPAAYAPKGEVAERYDAKVAFIGAPLGAKSSDTMSRPLRRESALIPSTIIKRMRRCFSS
jgi:hypothetical protein